MSSVWVRTGARLHFGQLDLNGSLGRLYGGLGLALDWPRIELTAHRSDRLELICPREKNRLESIARQYLEYFSLPGVKLELKQFFPSHAGFGSGTQLALAIGRAIATLYGQNPPPTELAAITDRENSRSGLGIASFFQGGFLVDGGKAMDGEGNISKQAPPILIRLPFPEEWSIILAVPKTVDKMFGKRESEAFKALTPMDELVSSRNCRLLLMKLLPAIVEKSLSTFGEAIEEIQANIGDYFAPVQGGRFSHVESLRMAECFSSLGLSGVGQSSWGPTVYGFCQKKDKEHLLNQVKHQAGEHVSIWATEGNNRGAEWGWI